MASRPRRNVRKPRRFEESDDDDDSPRQSPRRTLVVDQSSSSRGRGAGRASDGQPGDSAQTSSRAKGGKGDAQAANGDAQRGNGKGGKGAQGRGGRGAQGRGGKGGGRGGKGGRGNQNLQDEDDEDDEDDAGNQPRRILTNDQRRAAIQAKWALDSEETFVMFAHNTWRTTLRMYARVSNVQPQYVTLDLGTYFKAIQLRAPVPVPNGTMEQDGNTMEKVKISNDQLITWNVEVLDTDDFPWVLKPQRLADYNQFWMSQHMHLMPFRTRFLNELKESMSNNRTGDAHFRAWLTFPLLRRMQLERRRVAWRESLDPTVYSMATDPELDRPEPPVGNDPTIIQDPNDPTENVFVLDRIVGPLSRVDAFDSTKSNDQLIRRMEVSSWVLTNAIVVEMASIVFEATRLRENIEDDDANDESYLFLDKVFPVGMESAYHWSNTKLTGAAKKRSFAPIVNYAKYEIDNQGTTQPIVPFANATAFKDGAFPNWAPANDLISNIERSNLLIRPQISTLDSYIGTRVHLRLAAFPLAQRQPANDNDRVPLNPAILFGPSIAVERDGVILGQQAQRDALYSKDNAGVTTVDMTQLYRYIVSDPIDDLYVRAFCKPIEALFQQANGGTLHRLCTFDDANACVDVSLLATEYPIFHPFCMFWHTKHRVFKFFTTQIDFILRGTYQNNEKGVIIGEYKTLIENRQPTERIINPKAFSQALCNAILFELQTNIRVCGVLILFTTRRKTVYAAKIDIEKHRTSQAFVELVNVITMRPGFKDSDGLAYYDGRCYVSHTKTTFPKIQLQSETYELLPRLDMLPRRGAHDVAPFVGANNVVETWWDAAQQNNEANNTWMRLYGGEARVVTIANNNALRDDLFVAFTWTGQNVPTYAAPAVQNVGVREAFIDPLPASLNTNARSYPATEIVRHEAKRLELNARIVNAIIERSRIPYVVAVLNRAMIHLRRFWDHMITMDRFVKGQYTQANGQVAEINRVELADLFNDPPSFANAATHEAKRRVLLEILIRCAQRFENVLVAELKHNGRHIALNMQDNPNRADDEKTLSIKFVHNSQRAHWNEALLDFGNQFGAQYAVNEVIMHALAFQV